MYFRILSQETSGALTYLLADASAREAVVIDPQAKDLTVLTALLLERELRLRWVLRTHHHDTLKSAEISSLQALGAPIVQGDSVTGARVPFDGDILPFGDAFIRVTATPGHTLHCLSFAWRDRLFCGDLLAMHGCPHQCHPQQPETLWDSVTRKVFTLPDETLLFLGHVEQGRVVTTVLEQRRSHPWFAAMTRDEFLARMVVAQRDNRAEAIF